MQDVYLSCYLCGGQLTSDKESYLGICQLCDKNIKLNEDQKESKNSSSSNTK